MRPIVSPMTRRSRLAGRLVVVTGGERRQHNMIDYDQKKKAHRFTSRTLSLNNDMKSRSKLSSTRCFRINFLNSILLAVAGIAFALNLVWRPTPIENQQAAAASRRVDRESAVSKFRDGVFVSVGGDYYDVFWQGALLEAEQNEQRLHAKLQAIQGPCPKIYIYNLSSDFQDIGISDITSIDEAFGAAVPGWHGSLRETNQFGFAHILENRLRQPGSCYYTENPTEADLFYVSLFSKPKIELDWITRCRKFNATTLLPHLEHLNEQTACRHFVALSKGHFVGRPCKGWFWDPLPIFNHSIRLAYSHVPAEMGKKPSFRRRATDVREKMKRHPNLFSVPYPSSFHATARGEDLNSINRKPRKYLMNFVGSYLHGDIEVRKRIRDMCRSYQNHSICPTGRAKLGETATDLLIKRESIFCLEPVGDSPWRKSLSDSIVFGCIPVLFSNDTDDVAPWFWGDWKRQARVLVNRTDFVAGKIDLYNLLSTIPDRLLALMQDTLETFGRNFQYSLVDDDNDGIDLLLRGMLKHVDSTQSKGVCGS